MFGGTVSAEHGIGKLKRKYLSAMMGERYLNEMAASSGPLTRMAYSAAEICLMRVISDCTIIRD